jgi:hypothetical protein
LLFFPTLTVTGPEADIPAGVLAGMGVVAAGAFVAGAIAVAAGACVAGAMAVGGCIVGTAVDAGEQALTSKVKATSVVTIR